MEYLKIINLLDSSPNQPTKFRTKNWVEKNDESWETYNKDNKIRFKIVKGTITVANTAARGQANNGANKKVISKNCASLRTA